MYDKTMLEYYRKLRNISRRELSARSGVSYSAIQKYELGQKNFRAASYDTVITIAEILQVKPEELVKEDCHAGE